MSRTWQHLFLINLRALLHQPNRDCWNLCDRGKRQRDCGKWQQVDNVSSRNSVWSFTWHTWPGRAVRLGSKWEHAVWCSSHDSLLGVCEVTGLCTGHWETPAKRPRCLSAMIPLWIRAEGQAPSSPVGCSQCQAHLGCSMCAYWMELCSVPHVDMRK